MLIFYFSAQNDKLNKTIQNKEGYIFIVIMLDGQETFFATLERTDSSFVKTKKKG